MRAALWAAKSPAVNCTVLAKLRFRSFFSVEAERDAYGKAFNVSVPVAVKFAAVRLPEINSSPCTERLEAGVLVPMPSLPLVLSQKRLAEVFNAPVPAPNKIRPAVKDAAPVPPILMAKVELAERVPEPSTARRPLVSEENLIVEEANNVPKKGEEEALKV